MDTKNKRSIYQRYLTAWSPISDAGRLHVLVETMTSDIAYLDAIAKCDGRVAVANHIAGFQKRRPGCNFVVGNFLQYYDIALVNWRMVDASGTILVEGYDFTRFAEDGLISSITGFADTPAQRLEG